MNQEHETGVEGAFRRHAQCVYRLCYSYLGAADAEDATQSVFMKLVDEPREFNDYEHEKAWLLRVAANYCKDVLKSAGRTRVQGLVDQQGQPIDVPDPAHVGASEVLQAIVALPDDYKDCVYLHYYEGYKTDEIARMTDTKPSTVRNRLADARKMLKTALEA